MLEFMITGVIIDTILTAYLTEIQLPEFPTSVSA